jgi:hypothetical protein
MGGMAAPHEITLLLSFFMLVAASHAPIGTIKVVVAIRNNHWRFDMPMLLTLMTLVALSVGAWGLLLRHH